MPTNKLTTMSLQRVADGGYSDLLTILINKKNKNRVGDGRCNHKLHRLLLG